MLDSRYGVLGVKGLTFLPEFSFFFVHVISSKPQGTVPCALHLQTDVCTVDLATSNCFERAPSDVPDLFNNWLFQINAERLRLSLYSASGRVEMIYQPSPVKMAPEKLSVVINQNHSEEVKRPCCRKTWFIQTLFNRQNWLFTYNTLFIDPNFMNVSCDKVVCVPLIPSQSFWLQLYMCLHSDVNAVSLTLDTKW